MLPFLKHKKMSAIIMAKAKPEGGLEPMGEEDDNVNHALHSAAEDILSAIAMKDAAKLAEAIQAAFEICDEQPHEEGPHMDEELNLCWVR